MMTLGRLVAVDSYITSDSKSLALPFKNLVKLAQILTSRGLIVGCSRCVVLAGLRDVSKLILTAFCIGTVSSLARSDMTSRVCISS